MSIFDYINNVDEFVWRKIYYSKDPLETLALWSTQTPQEILGQFIELSEKLS